MLKPNLAILMLSETGFASLYQNSQDGHAAQKSCSLNPRTIDSFSRVTTLGFTADVIYLVQAGEPTLQAVKVAAGSGAATEALRETG